MTQKQCYRQEFRLVPTADVTQVLLYCLGYFVAKYGVSLHEFFFMSNHEHLEMTDGTANRPQFFAAFHSLVARAINSRYGDTDSMWSSKPNNAVVLHDGDSRIEKSVYILTNCVLAELVRYAWDWPGATSYSMEYDRPILIKKPPFFFSKDMPDEVELVLRRPPDTRPDLNDQELRALIRQRVREEQGAIAAEMRRAGRTFMGKERVLRVSRHACPRHRPIRNGIHPLVATKNAELRIAAIDRDATFRAEHAIARRRRTAGDATAVFPYGTYMARVRDGAPCKGPDP